jgi:hypothetical protein
VSEIKDLVVSGDKTSFYDCKNLQKSI